jgi:hypothetical protein
VKKVNAVGVSTTTLVSRNLTTAKDTTGETMAIADGCDISDLFTNFDVS